MTDRLTIGDAMRMSVNKSNLEKALKLAKEARELVEPEADKLERENDDPILRAAYISLDDAIEDIDHVINRE